MALEQRDKELVAIGASIGALCRPCIDHHIRAGRDAGLSDVELTRAVKTAQSTQRLAQQILFRHTDNLVEPGAAQTDVPVSVQPSPRDDELVALGACVGANSHPLLEGHIARVLEHGLITSQVRSAIKMAEIVQQNAARITAEKATTVLGLAESTPVPA